MDIYGHQLMANDNRSAVDRLPTSPSPQFSSDADHPIGETVVMLVRGWEVLL